MRAQKARQVPRICRKVGDPRLRRHRLGIEPDGHELAVRRERGSWTVRCCGANKAQNRILDVALIEAIRAR